MNLYAVIGSGGLSSRARAQRDGGYAAMAETMLALASEQPGFMGIESVRGSDGLGMTVSYWASDEAIRNWKMHSGHQVAQRRGRREWYANFVVRVAKVERAYGC
jgi:heme-degrading monooxygenase HmoA